MGEHDVILQYIPKNADPKNTSRVYFACHPEDHHTYFDEVADQLLSVGLSGGSTITLWHRNAASLCADQSAALMEQLSSMQLFVVAVTPRLPKALCRSFFRSAGAGQTDPSLPSKQIIKTPPYLPSRQIWGYFYRFMGVLP